MRSFTILLCLLALTACTNPEHVPGNIIPRDSMQNILFDIMQADQYSTQYLLKDSAKINVKSETMKLYEEVFRLHHISKTEFDRSFQFYLDHPNIATVMFDSLSARAARLRAEAYSNPPGKNPGQGPIQLHKPEVPPLPKVRVKKNNP